MNNKYLQPQLCKHKHIMSMPITCRLKIPRPGIYEVTHATVEKLYFFRKEGCQDQRISLETSYKLILI